MLTNIGLALIPIFVAVDPIGLVPMFITLTAGLNAAEKRRVIVQSMITAIVLAVGFMFIGKAVFQFLGITIGDFMIAGGAILFCLAILDLINPVKKRIKLGDDMGVVPLGTPLIVGPGVLTISLVIIPEYGLVPTLISVVGNILLAGVICYFSFAVIKVLGKAGTKAVTKIVSLLLAAYAVMLIRKGLEQFL